MAKHDYKDVDMIGMIKAKKVIRYLYLKKESAGRIQIFPTITGILESLFGAP